MILCYGHEIVSKILSYLHIWKCTGNIEEARPFWEKYSQVNEYFLKIRKIIQDNDFPRRLFLYHNLNIDEELNVTVEYYPDTLEGIIKSFVDRYNIHLNKHIYNQWTKYDTNFIK